MLQMSSSKLRLKSNTKNKKKVGNATKLIYELEFRIRIRHKGKHKKMKTQNGHLGLGSDKIL